ncbi:leukocidin/hemolysin toxin family protein [Bacillus cytotoxicus]|uniref:Leukocidin/hemolysin toxin family protein n=2 Tax=Bacillus cytotoxicus TaxID=580165 RepID=A0ACC6A5A6_9BACI|nr:leukocidin/hemolysin toxin family protein [Bacillus cytotoxicus]
MENLVPQDKLPSLTAYGFQPGAIAIITADKGMEYFLRYGYIFCL